MTQLGTEARPLRVAIVGSGPAGFYAAEALLKSATSVRVDMFDRLPTPYGLVRGGVAPDHQKIKSVIKVYERIAAQDRFAFWGNVTIGRDLTLEELRRFYDAVLFASGAESDRRLGIPGEDLPGSHTATEFVGWYNGHPDYRGRVFDLAAEKAVVAGQGNVAMDVSRILAKTPEELMDSDIAAHALDALTHSAVREVHVVGRRGPVQAKLTPPELKEIGELAACDVVVDPAELVLDPASQAELDDPENTHSRKNLALMREFSERPAPTRPRRYHLRFFLSPVELRGNGRVEEVVLERNRLTGEPGRLKAVGTGERITQDCRLFFRSVGYRGVAIPGVSFDERAGVIPNRDGRVLEGERILPGLYVAGWIKRGPSGVIGTNKPCSAATVEVLLADLDRLEPCPSPDGPALAETLRDRGVRVVTFEDWKKIDAAEIAGGQAKGKPREKLTTVAEMLALLD